MRAEEFIDEENLEEFSTTDKGIRTELEAKGYQYLGKGVDQTAYLGQQSLSNDTYRAIEKDPRPNKICPG